MRSGWRPDAQLGGPGPVRRGTGTPGDGKGESWGRCQRRAPLRAEAGDTSCEAVTSAPPCQPHPHLQVLDSTTNVNYYNVVTVLSLLYTVNLKSNLRLSFDETYEIMELLSELCLPSGFGDEPPLPTDGRCAAVPTSDLLPLRSLSKVTFHVICTAH